MAEPLGIGGILIAAIVDPMKEHLKPSKIAEHIVSGIITAAIIAVATIMLAWPVVKSEFSDMKLEVAQMIQVQQKLLITQAVHTEQISELSRENAINGNP